MKATTEPAPAELTLEDWGGPWWAILKDISGSTMTIRLEDLHTRNPRWNLHTIIPRLTGLADLIRASQCGWITQVATGNFLLPHATIQPKTPPDKIRKQVTEYMQFVRQFHALIWKANYPKPKQ